MFWLFGKSKKNQQTNRGFTLLELIVVIAIFLIITAVVIADIPNFHRRSSLDLVTSEIITYIRGAQTYGASQKGVTTGPSTPLVYGIHISPTLNDIREGDFYLFRDDKNPPHEEGYSIKGFKILMVKDNSGRIYSGGQDIVYRANSQVSSLGTNTEPSFFSSFNGNFSEANVINSLEIRIVSNNDPNICKKIIIFNNGQISPTSCD